MIGNHNKSSRAGWVLAALALAGLGGCGSVSTSTSKNEPTIDSIQPDNGSITGGTMVTITGKQLNKGTPIVVVGGHLATSVTATSDTQLTFVLPPGDQEGATVDVTVSNDAGFAEKPASFTYNHQPVVLSISPAIGKSTGGVNVTISGRGFMAANAGTASITIAGGTATNVHVVDDKTITATTGPVAAGTQSFTALDVTVTNANGTGTLTGGYKVTSQGLIMFDRFTPSNIWHFDPATGQAALIATTTRRLGGCALNPATGVMFAESRNPTTNVHELVTLDPLTGNVTPIGPTNDGATNRGIGSLTFVGNTLFGLSSDRGGCCSSAVQRLVSINQTTGALTVIGATPQAVLSSNGIAVKDANTVYYAHNTSQSLDTIAVGSSAKTTGLAFAGGTGADIVGVINAGSTMFVVEKNNPGAIVYTLDPNTAALTKIGTVSTAALVSGTCQTPASF